MHQQESTDQHSPRQGLHKLLERYGDGQVQGPCSYRAPEIRKADFTQSAQCQGRRSRVEVYADHMEAKDKGVPVLGQMRLVWRGGGKAPQSEGGGSVVLFFLIYFLIYLTLFYVH